MPGPQRRISGKDAPDVTIEQIIVGSGDTLNFPADQSVGITQGNVLEATIGTSDVGIATVQGPSELLTRQIPAAEVVSTTVELVSSQHVNVGSLSAGSDWDNPANFQAAPDSTYAELQEGLVLTQGSLIGDFPNFVNKTALTIDQVTLTFYYAVSDFLLAGTTLQVQYRLGALGVPTTLKTLTGGIVTPVSENHLAGETFDVTADRAWTWTNLNDLQVVLAGTMLVDAGLSNVIADACLLTVTANLTEAA